MPVEMVDKTSTCSDSVQTNAHFELQHIYSYKSFCFWIEMYHLSSSRKICEIKSFGYLKQKVDESQSWEWCRLLPVAWRLLMLSELHNDKRPPQLCTSDCLWFNLNRGVRWAGLLHIQPPPHPTPPHKPSLFLSLTHTHNQWWMNNTAASHLCFFPAHLCSTKVKFLLNITSPS